MGVIFDNDIAGLVIQQSRATHTEFSIAVKPYRYLKANLCNLGMCI